MSLKVIGAGFGRTGTSSLKGALEQLGLGPCHHMVEVFRNPDQVALWDRVATSQPFKWEEAFAQYQSSCDWPSCTFYRELAEHYPDAKIILTLRDAKSWYKSVSNTIMPAMKKSDGSGHPLPGVFGPLLIGERTFGNDFSEGHMIDVYEQHNEEVKRTIPASRLLVFEAENGWDPLCKFLGVPVPTTPYPKNNTTEEFQARRAAMAKAASH